MTTVVRYVGLQPKSEVAITGLGRRWWPGELRPLDDATARLLTLAGQGWEVERDSDTYLDETAVPGAGIRDASSLTLADTDANTTRIAAGTQTYTIDAATAWLVLDGIAVALPASGTVSFAVSGAGVTLNGGTSTLTRTLADNSLGYVVLNRVQSASGTNYSLSGV